MKIAGLIAPEHKIMSSVTQNGQEQYELSLQSATVLPSQFRDTTPGATGNV